MASPFFGKNSELCLAMLLFLVSRNLNLSARSRTSPRGPRLTQHVVTRVAGQIDLEAKNHCRATSWYYQGQRCASSVCRASFSPAVQQHRPPPSQPRISTVRCISPASSTAVAVQPLLPRKSPACRAVAPPAALKPRLPRRSHVLFHCYAGPSDPPPAAATTTGPGRRRRYCRRRPRPGSRSGQRPRRRRRRLRLPARVGGAGRPAPTGAQWGRRVP